MFFPPLVADSYAFQVSGTGAFHLDDRYAGYLFSRKSNPRFVDRIAQGFFDLPDCYLQGDPWIRAGHERCTGFYL